MKNLYELKKSIFPNGAIDKNEVKWLRARIQSKGYIDKIDGQLLANLCKKSIDFSQILNFKHRFDKAFEDFLFRLCFITCGFRREVWFPL